MSQGVRIAPILEANGLPYEPARGLRARQAPAGAAPETMLSRFRPGKSVLTPSVPVRGHADAQAVRLDHVLLDDVRVVVAGSVANLGVERDAAAPRLTPLLSRAKTLRGWRWRPRAGSCFGSRRGH